MQLMIALENSLLMQFWKSRVNLAASQRFLINLTKVIGLQINILKKKHSVEDAFLEIFQNSQNNDFSGKIS